jgi:polysaccharide export outer membrane protein
MNKAGLWIFLSTDIIVIRELFMGLYLSILRDGASFLVLSAALLAIGGCSFFPVSGPNSLEVKSESSTITPYALVQLTPAAIDVLAQYEPKGLAGTFTDRKPPAHIKFGIGDIVSVTVFEAAAGGLFIPTEAGIRPGNYVTIPDQAVDNEGNISVPYAGLIKANGRTNVEVQNEIIARIKNRAIEPQIIVALSSQRTNLVSVMGEVNTPVRYAAAASGAEDRITDALTRAGGIRGQGFESWVMLERHGRRATVPFENLVMTPANNIYIQPGDRLYVYREQQKFIAFGASGQQGEYNFDAWRINLAEGVAKAGGLVDAQADPGSVFLYRREPKEVAALLGADVSRFPGDIVPVIFSTNFRDPSGYFLATKIQMRNQDIIFVANAESVEVNKFLSFVNNVVSTAANTTTAINGAYVARAAGAATTINTTPLAVTP